VAESRARVWEAGEPASVPGAAAGRGVQWANARVWRVLERIFGPGGGGLGDGGAFFGRIPRILGDFEHF
jgi:hypothetical protein